MRVKERLDKCLQGTNLTEEFEREGYLAIAQKNAVAQIRIIREVVPMKFSNSYVSPCWETHLEIFEMKGYIKTNLNHVTYTSTISEFTTIARKTLNYIGMSPNAARLNQTSKLQHAAGRNTNTFHSLKPVCLPKIFLAGFSKCGSTFLYCVLSRLFHSNQVEKEPHWWIPRGPAAHPRKPEAMHALIYLLNFLDTSHKLASGRYTNTKYHQPLTIDGSPNLMYHWPRWYENEPPVNYCLLPAVIPEVLPESKFVVMMRNPVDMLYSVFWNSCTSNSNLSEEVALRGPDIFHERTVAKIEQFKVCNRIHSLQWCLITISYDQFSPEMPVCGRSRLGVGVYVAHIQRWLSAVPRDKFLFLTLEELSGEIERVKRELWSFVGFPESSRHWTSDEQEQLRCGTNTQNSVPYHSDSRLYMRKYTRKVLTEFYRPYNQLLANVLNDTKFLWRD